MRKILAGVASLLIGSGLVMAGVGSAAATPPNPNHKVSICHRTNSVTNPYVKITVDEASVDMNTGNDKGKGDHNAEHNGPVFDPKNPPPPPHNGDQWGDIIPPFYANGDPGTWPSKNWPAGQSIFDNGCKVVASTPTPTPTPTATPTPTPTKPVVVPTPTPTPTAPQVVPGAQPTTLAKTGSPAQTLGLLGAGLGLVGLGFTLLGRRFTA